MRVLYLWLTMGTYHVARMKAIQAIPDVQLDVLEVTNLDDHEWQIDTSELRNHRYLFEQEMLSPALIRKASGRLVDDLKDRNYDIIVNGAGYAHTGIQKVLESQKGSAKLILWSETTALDNATNFVKEWIKKRRVRAYDGAIVAGRLHQEYLKDLGMPQSQIQIVGNVVSNDRFRNVGTGRAGDNLGFLYVGRLLPIKNVDGLIQAYKRYLNLDNTDAKLPLTIVGDGPERDRLQKMAAGVRNGEIRFLGNKQPDEIPELYANAKVFVLPSISEPWGLVTNEAMASGLPVLISNKCGSSEMINHGENGLLFTPKDQMELAELMATVTENDQLRSHLAQNAVETIKEYTPEKYAERCAKFFKTLSS
jgi:1,2-diacylglycerol 3-alpha-glucosyltransferase